MSLYESSMATGSASKTPGCARQFQSEPLRPSGWAFSITTVSPSDSRVSLCDLMGRLYKCKLRLYDHLEYLQPQCALSTARRASATPGSVFATTGGSFYCTTTWWTVEKASNMTSGLACSRTNLKESRVSLHNIRMTIQDSRNEPLWL
jgi:hypothetical protein